MRRDEKRTAYSEEASGALVALFSVAVILVAVFSCILVASLTVDWPTLPNAESSSSADSLVTSAPMVDSTPLFTPSQSVILPTATESTKPANVESGYAVLVDAADGKILAAKNAEERFNPASMTKVMTLLVACERLTTGELERELTFTEAISNYVRPQSGPYAGTSSHWADVGDGATLRDQLYGIAVESAADCTVMVACYLVGKSPAESEAQMVAWMNEKVSQMGLKNTRFDNIVGHESENNYTTASDMAAIMIRALECPLIAELLSTPSYRATNAFGYNKDHSLVRYGSTFYSTLFNANKDRSSRFKAYSEKYGTEFQLNSLTFKGGKTGSLKDSGGWNYSLVSFASDASGRIYVAVTSNVQEGHAVMKDAKELYDNCLK